jgi:ABC-type branched-subunit amino acid transport system substrate-binding protein
MNRTVLITGTRRHGGPVSLPSSSPRLGVILVNCLVVVAALAGRIEAEERGPGPAGADLFKLPPIARWTSFGAADGLPSEKVFCIRVDGDRLWAGTEKGLACREGDRWRTYGVKDGLPNAVILALEVSPRTGELWIGTMGGLARLSGGRIDAFTQLSSGLSNDFVNAVRCDADEDQVWAATAMGASRLDLRTMDWTIYNHENTPMSEPWTYSVAIDRGLVYVGAWGGGILELEKRSGRWREYRDPDHEMEIDLLPDDGPVHDVTSGVEFREGILWQTSYFGMARYDGRRWSSYFKEDSGLASNFVQFVRARGPIAWCCTDQGLSATDGMNWATYLRREDGKGEVVFTRGKRRLGSIQTETALAHGFVLGVDFQGDAVWVATEKGVSRGEPGPDSKVPDFAAAPAENAPAAGPVAAAPPPLQPRFPYSNTPEEFLPYLHLPIYHQFYLTPPEFNGAGREKQEPETDEVRIGFIGPLEDEDGPVLPPGFRSGSRGDPKAVLFGRPMLRGAQLAIEEANQAGGYRGKPFRLISRTDLVQWGQTSNELAQFAYTDGVRAILSGVESNHQHVLARATLKAEVPIVNAGSADPTLMEHAMPWIVRVMSDDRQNSYLILDYICRVRGLSRIAVLRVNDRDGRVGIGKFVQGARRINHPVVIEQRFLNGDRDFASQLETIAGAHPDGLYLLGNPEELGLIVKQARARGMTLPIFAGERSTHPRFLEVAGAAAEGMVAAACFNPQRDDPRWTGFRERYRRRFGEDPNAYAAHAFDGLNFILAAIRSSGLNRAAIRDYLFAQKAIDGVTGRIEFDTNVSNVRRPWLAEVRGGAYHYFQLPRKEEVR